MIFSKKTVIGMCLASSMSTAFGSSDPCEPFTVQSTNSIVGGENIYTIDFETDLAICDVDLIVDLDTANGWGTNVDNQDVDLTLTNPMGMKSSAIIDGDCPTGDTTLHVTFDDDAPTGVTDAICADTSGNAVAQPDTPLNVFDNYSAKGTWELRVDNSWIGGGNIHWTVVTTPCEGVGACMGDPHFKTWSGKWYDFHAECDLAFLNNPKFDNNLGMWIHIRTKARDEFSYIETAAVRIGDDTFEVTGYGEYSVNGVQDASMPAVLAENYPVTHTPVNKKMHLFEIELGEGKQIVIKVHKDLVSVKTVGAIYADYGRSTGLMGQFGNGRMLGRNGTVISDPDEFGNEWQVLDTEPMLFESSRHPQHPVKCIMPRDRPSLIKEGRRRLGESIAEEAAMKACEHWGEQKEQCIYDVMALGDLEVAEAGAF